MNISPRYIFLAGGAALFLWWLKMKNEVDFLARTIWGEARGEVGDVINTMDDDEGMQAVANVVMNRVKRQSWFGSGVIGVVLKDWQFSVWNMRDPNRVKVLGVTDADPAFVRAMKIATQAVNGKLDDLTMGATHYHHYMISPDWSNAKNMTRTVWIGNHLFYRED